MAGPNDMSAEIPPETLMAYADGTLSAEEAARVEQAVAASPALREELKDYRLSRSAVDQALRPLDQLPVPPALVDLILTRKESSQPSDAQVINLAERRKPRPLWIDALAAGVLLSVGLGLGGSLSGGGSSPAAIFAMMDNGALAPDSFLAATLESGASAVARLRGEVQVKPVQTFMAGETPCREFEILSRDAGSIGIACRREEGWRVETMVAAKVTGATGSFQLASGPQDALLESALAALNASPGLEADAERCLMSAGWSAKSSCEIP